MADRLEYFRNPTYYLARDFVGFMLEQQVMDMSRGDATISVFFPGGYIDESSLYNAIIDTVQDEIKNGQENVFDNLQEKMQFIWRATPTGLAASINGKIGEYVDVLMEEINANWQENSWTRYKPLDQNT